MESVESSAAIRRHDHALPAALQGSAAARASCNDRPESQNLTHNRITNGLTGRRYPHDPLNGRKAPILFRGHRRRGRQGYRAKDCSQEAHGKFLIRPRLSTTSAKLWLSDSVKAVLSKSCDHYSRLVLDGAC
jgi:hypothetical protein